jgi:hypothetical protein
MKSRGMLMAAASAVKPDWNRPYVRNGHASLCRARKTIVS